MAGPFSMANLYRLRAERMAAQAPMAQQAPRRNIISPMSSAPSGERVSLAPAEAPRVATSAPARLGRAPAEKHYFMADGELNEAAGPSDYDFGNGITFGALIAAGLPSATPLGKDGAHGSVYLYNAAGKQYIIKKITDEKPAQVREINMLGKAQKSAYAMRLLAGQTGEDGRSGYILSDYVPGVTLLEWINMNSSTADYKRDLKALLNQVVDGLQALHAEGIIHRDIKPENVWVPDEGHIFFLDFGSATRAGAESIYLGTNTYARPNNLSKSRVANVINNYYALGAIIEKTLAANNEGLSEYYKNRRRTKDNGTRKFGGKRRRRRNTRRK